MPAIDHKPPSAYRIQTTLSEYHTRLTQFHERLVNDPRAASDEQIIAATLGDLRAPPEQLLARSIDAEVWAEMRVKEADDMRIGFTLRRNRYQEHVDYLRSVIDGLLRLLKLSDHRGKLGSAAIVATPHSVEIISEDRIPEHYWKIERALKRSEIKRALESGEEVPGAQLTERGETLRITPVTSR